MDHSPSHVYEHSCKGPPANNTSYNPHVTWTPLPITAGSALDCSLASVLVLLASVSVLGNALALRYFLSTQRRDLGTLLYVGICVCDILTGFLNLPIGAALFRERAPGPFNSFHFCIFWDIVSMTVGKVSLLLVMLLSVSRAVSIAFPFHKLNKRVIISIPLIYTLVTVTQKSVMVKLAKFSFSSDTPYCYRYYSDNGYDHVEVFNQIIESLQAGVSPIVTFMSFLVCLAKLLGVRRGADCPVLSQQHNRHAAVTVTMFTGLFLTCYVPYFILIILESIMFGYNTYEYPDPYFTSCFMYWYSWIIARAIFPLINSTLDPVLYLLRMSGFGEWLGRVRKGIVNTRVGRRRGIRRRSEDKCEPLT